MIDKNISHTNYLIIIRKLFGLPLHQLEWYSCG